jgi:uncharacterized protein YbjT (DUF2867 family)
MRVMVAGASGFIGSHIAADLQARGHEVVGAARDVKACRQRAPNLDWIACDFRRDSRADWLLRLADVDVVINCVGVLQDGLGDNSRAAHVEGARALFEASRDAGVRRVIHISAAGADDDAGTAYADDKRAGEDVLKASVSDWIILRPSLVVARNVYGGTSLIRALAGLPFFTPVVGADKSFRPIGMDDLCAAVEECLSPESEACVSLDLGGPECLTMGDTLRAYRRWLGFGKTRILDVPTWLARPAFWVGDVLGWLGVRTSMRSTSLKQLQHDAAGDPADWLARTAIQPRTLEAYLASSPAGVQDRWHARLGFARPIARLVLGLYWLLTGVLALTVAKDHAYQVLTEAGFDAGSRPPILWFGSLFDIALGGAMLLKWRVRTVAAIMIGGTFGYVGTLSLVLPGLWADALGPILKVFPMMVLALMIAATEDER